MEDYTELESLVLWQLLDDEGHPTWQIAEQVAKKKSNINPILKKLEVKGIVFQGAQRKTTRPGSERPNQPEIPYFITKTIEVFKSLVLHASRTINYENQGKYLAKRLLYSKYTNAMIKQEETEEVYNIVKIFST